MLSCTKSGGDGREWRDVLTDHGWAWAEVPAMMTETQAEEPAVSARAQTYELVVLAGARAEGRPATGVGGGREGCGRRRGVGRFCLGWWIFF